MAETTDTTHEHRSVFDAPKKKPAKDAPKPRTASLFKSMSPETIDLDSIDRAAAVHHDAVRAGGDATG